MQVAGLGVGRRRIIEEQRVLPVRKRTQRIDVKAARRGEVE